MTRTYGGLGRAGVRTLMGAALFGSLAVACGRTSNESSGTKDAPPEVSESPGGEDRQGAPSPSEAPTHRLVLLSSHGDSLRLVQQKVLDGPGPRAPKDLHHAAWSFDALGSDGKVVFRDNVMNPHFVRGEFAPKDGGTTPDHVEVVRPEPSSLTIRVPANTTSVRFYDEPLMHRNESRIFAEVELPEGSNP